MSNSLAHAQFNEPIGSLKREDAASLLNVGSRSVIRARSVIERGTLELIQAVERGEVTVTLDAQICASVRLPPLKTVQQIRSCALL